MDQAMYTVIVLLISSLFLPLLLCGRVCLEIEIPLDCECIICVYAV